jgi:hypothetical protein
MPRPVFRAGYAALVVGGPWLWRIWPQGEIASVLPSGCRRSFQPCRWMQAWWWYSHYAELLVMPMPGFPALVAGAGALSGSA